MKRRTFIAGLGSAAAWPVVARAQQTAMPVIGLLHTSEPNPDNLAAFRKGLGETGYVEGRNVAIEYRFAQNESDRLPALAADLVRRRVAVIATPGSSEAALAAKSATTTIPIVFGIPGDPVQSGLVASLNRPGGNATGLTVMNGQLGGKQLEFLHELVPGAKRFALLINPNNPIVESSIADLRAAASAIRGQIDVLYASTSREIDAAFASLVERRDDALLVSSDPVFASLGVQHIALAARYAVPAIYGERQGAQAGGLMSYGSSNLDRYLQVGIYTGRILKGEKPADLPVMRATKFELVINAKTAKALGLTIPETLLATADEVIQ